MVESKGWEWEQVEHKPWLEPVDQVYYLVHKWALLGYHSILDLGSGLGRHSIFFAKHGFKVYSIAHTDTLGMRKTIGEIRRVLKTNGEVYASVRSKDSQVFRESNYPKLDPNTLINKEDGPEYDVPHYFADIDD
ncbi:methyltransferase type 11 [Lachnospiraceae bacterium KM106-2]|nr:methyltransferase type 11 [Lachnospiraceae bacterium KM106-2]